MNIKVNGVEISIENSSPAAKTAPARAIESFAADMENIIRSEEAMDTTITLMSNLAKTKAIRGQEGFSETMKNVGNSIANFIEKIVRAISQFIGNKVAEAQIKKLENTLAKTKDAAVQQMTLYGVPAAKVEAFNDTTEALFKEKDEVINSLKAGKKFANNVNDFVGVISDLNAVTGTLNDALSAGTKDVNGTAFKTLDRSGAESILNDAKNNYRKLYANLQAIQKTLNGILAELKQQDKANAGDSRTVGRLSGKVFKALFNYCGIIGSIRVLGGQNEQGAKAPASN
jgi:hypothetical protein